MTPYDFGWAFPGESNSTAPKPAEDKYVLVWAVEPISKRRYVTLKKLSEVKPDDERVKW